MKGVVRINLDNDSKESKAAKVSGPLRAWKSFLEEVAFGHHRSSNAESGR